MTAKLVEGLPFSLVLETVLCTETVRRAGGMNHFGEAEAPSDCILEYADDESADEDEADEKVVKDVGVDESVVDNKPLDRVSLFPVLETVRVSEGANHLGEAEALSECILA